MLRTILGAKRRVLEEESGAEDIEIDPQSNSDREEENVLEPWVDFIKRTTHQIEGLAATAGIEH